MNITEETLFAVALSRIGRSNPADFLRLYNTLGSAKAVYDHRDNILDVIPDATPRLVKALQNLPDACAPPKRKSASTRRMASRHWLSMMKPIRNGCAIAATPPSFCFIEVRQTSISVASSPS